MRITNKAQSTLEYLIILSAITAGIIIFATTTLKDKVGTMYDNAINASVNITAKVGDNWK